MFPNCLSTLKTALNSCQNVNSQDGVAQNCRYLWLVHQPCKLAKNFTAGIVLLADMEKGSNIGGLIEVLLLM